jgi:hypothetical protein
MKSLTYLIGVVSGLLFTSAQAQSSDPFTGVNEIPLLDNQSLSQYEKTFHPPLPDIWVDGVLMSWEEVYGPIVILPPPVADNMSRSASSSALLRTQQVADSYPFTRYFADPSSRMFLLSASQYPPLQLDFLRLQKLSDQHASQLPSPSTNLTLKMLQSVDTNGKNQTGITGTVDIGGVQQDYTVYKLLATNISSPEEIEIFFSEKADFKQPLSTSISCVGSNYLSKTYVVTVEGHHSSGFFTAAFVSDSDKDGLSDAVEELIFKSSPTNHDSVFWVDLDGNELPDYPSIEGNSICDGDEDLDQDGWSNADEIAMGTDPFVANDNHIVVSMYGGASLPNWMEQSLFIKKGCLNITLLLDSDNDGVDNYTELLLKTNPTMLDSFFVSGNFTGLPDMRRAFQFPPITIGKGSLLTSYNTYCENFGTLGNYFHFESHANKTLQGTNLVSTPDYYTILMNGAYLNPANSAHNDNQGLTRPGESAQSMQRCCFASKNLLGASIQILNNAWSYAAVTNNSLSVNELSNLESEVIAQRAKDRILFLMRKIQLISGVVTNFAQLEPVIQKRVLKCVGDIYMETQLYHKACQRYFYTHPDSLPPKEAYCFQFNPGLCMVANMDGMNTLDSLSDNYVLDVRNQNNNNSFSMDLSTGIQNLFVNTTHQSNININEMLLYSVFYEILSDFLKD